MASSSEMLTLQIEALNKVHNNNAISEMKDLKRKLADCEKDLASTRNVLLRTENGRTVDGYDAVRQSKEGLEELDKISDKLRDRSNNWRHGITLSMEDIGQLMHSVAEAKLRFLDNKRTMGGDSDPESQDEDESENEDEDEDEDQGNNEGEE